MLCAFSKPFFSKFDFIPWVAPRKEMNDIEVAGAIELLEVVD